MQRRSSIGSSRASSLRIENRSSSEQYRRSSSIGNDIYADFRVPCKLCAEPINAGTMVNAAGYSWHADCFVCKCCTISLTEYHKHNDELLCEECMAKSTGVCEMCHKQLGNSYVISNNTKYHTGCFICSQCSLPLGTKENYTLCQEGQIICDNCHENNMMSLMSNERSVETRWGNISTEILPDGQMRVSDISEGNCLKRNDIIVAVNGAAVDTAKMSALSPDCQVTLTVSSPGNRSRVASDADVPLHMTTPPSPPPPSTRPHKRRLLKSLSTSPPPTVDNTPNNTPNNHPSYIFKPSQVEIGAVIGCGFFGRVCEAKLLETGERICLKELQHVDTASAKAFIDEVAILKTLKHTNVLAFKGIVSSPPTFSLLTEYVGGGTLRSLIKAKDVPIPWSRRLDIALDVSSGMSYLHSKEIIHRDLTSKNCLLHLNGTVVVADFGLAQYQQASHYNHISYLCPPVYHGKRRNNSVGAVYWRAPEMIFDKPYDYKVDVFSYGIVMCELVARIKADPDILPRNITDWGLDEPRFRELVPPDCPSSFLSVVIQCCCTVPELRPNFAKMSDFLHQFIGSKAAEDYDEVLFSITRTLHSICEDD